MKLTDLEPRWISPDVFMFKNPTGGSHWLTCKRVRMAYKDQCKLLWKDHPEYKGWPIVLTEPDCAWQFAGNDFATMTVRPSLNFNPSGDFHGFITNGEVTNA